MPHSRSTGFSLVHHAWNSIPATPLSEKASLRRLVGGASETWWLDLRPSAAVRTDGIAGECTFTLMSGRVMCTVLGNEIELRAGHFALLPPNLPIALRTAGRTPAAVVVHVAGVLPAAVPLEGL